MEEHGSGSSHWRCEVAVKNDGGAVSIPDFGNPGMIWVSGSMSLPVDDSMNTLYSRQRGRTLCSAEEVSPHDGDPSYL